MKIGIIGAGFTGLAAAYKLSKKGHQVEVFERDANPGGLAVGYREKSWEWTLEQHYHHWFTNDKSVLKLAEEINHRVLIKRPKTSAYIDAESYQLDSPGSVLTFPKLTMAERLRMAATLGLFKYNLFWQPLEKFNATRILPRLMGKRPYKLIWEPLFHNKFGPYAGDISLAWFAARVYKRTPSLIYPEGGFLNFAQHLEREIRKRGGKFHYNTEVFELRSAGKPKIGFKKNNLQSIINPDQIGINNQYDRVVVTLPSFLFLKIAPELPDTYRNKLNKLESLGATNLVIRLKKQFFSDNTYWLNVCDPKSPIMAIVEHTNFMDKKHYNNEHIVYLGNYMPASDPRFSLTAEQTLKLYDPWLKKINPNYRLSLIGYRLFRAPFAQPIIPTNYSKNIPPMETPLKNVYMANIEQVYPWDRGTNYAAELGERVSKLIV